MMRRHDFQAPARILEQREARTCRGCMHLIEAPLFDLRYVTCRKAGAQHWPSG